MTPRTETRTLISELTAASGASAEARRNGRIARLRATLPLEGWVLAAMALSFLLCGSLARLLLPAPRGLWQTLIFPAFDFKIVAMAILAIGGFAAVRQCSRPGLPPSHWLWFLPGLAFLGLASLVDPSGFPVFGRDSSAVPSCAFAIIALSLLPLAAMLWLMSRGVVTRPVLAGTAAGLLAGAIGGAAYALVCRNDGAVFVALWYGAAILASAAIGALIGGRLLRW
ncbi:DUF1109 domain-containing protein [Thioclava sp. BHET1]|nr:DUF1109 domain-containing protein [Thioclava sp. BHET1]